MKPEPDMGGRKPATRYRAVLTGASGGIGKAIARELVGRADWLILAGRNVEALRAIQGELGEQKAHVVHGDMEREETLQAIEALAAELGGANLLINNAGTSDFHAQRLSMLSTTCRPGAS